MRWKTRKPKPKPRTSWKKYDFVYVCKFAWWPTPVQQGDTYWLEYVSYGYRALEDTNNKPGNFNVYYTTENDWSSGTIDYVGHVEQKIIEHVHEVWKLEFIIPWEKRHDLYNEKYDSL